MKIKLDSYDYDNNYQINEIEIRLKDIDGFLHNSIFVRTTYKHWIKTGKMEIIEYFLTPESLKILLDSIIGTRYEKKLLFNSSRVFIKNYPDFNTLKLELERIKSLPVAEPEKMY